MAIGAVAKLAKYVNQLINDAGIRAALVASGGAGLVGFIRSAVGTVARTVWAKLQARVSIDDFGALQDGTTACDGALQKALDSLPAWGGVVEFEGPGPYKFDAPVGAYIPQRISLFGAPGITIRGNGARVIGNGSNTFLESGKGQYSSPSLGGASNFGEPPESATSIHYNTSIEGFKLSGFGDPIRLFNFIQGCRLRDIYASDFDILGYFKKCFYLQLDNVFGRPLDAARAATTPILWFDTDNNTITMNNVHVSGVDGANAKHGIGVKFSGGVQALNLTNFSTEGCVTGMKLESFIYNMNIDSVYFEFNTTHLDASTANILHMTVDNNWFDSGAVAINATSWVNGKLGAGNYFSGSAGTVTLGAGSTCEVELPAQQHSELNHTTWLDVPAGWSINPGCKITRNDIIFNSGVGFNAPWFRNAPASTGNGIVPLAYTGECFNVGGTIPYVNVTGLGTGTLVFDTKIKWNANLSAVRFDLLIAHSANAVIAGVLSANNTIFRDDAVAGITITPSNNGGYLRLTMAGFGTTTSYSGKIRII